MNKKLLTTNQFAKIIGVRRATVQTWCAQGRIEAGKIKNPVKRYPQGGREIYMIPYAEVQRVLQAIRNGEWTKRGRPAKSDGGPGHSAYVLLTPEEVKKLTPQERAEALKRAILKKESDEKNG